MTAADSSPRFRLSRGQWFLGGIWALVIVALETFIVITYFATQQASLAFGADLDVQTDLVNVQRHAFLLSIETGKLLNNPSASLAEIDRQRAVLLAQLNILRGQAAGKPDVLDAVQKTEAALQAYDTLIAPMREAPSAELALSLRPEVEKLFDNLDRELLKPTYDQAETRFYERVSQNLRTQQQGQLLLLGMGILFFVTGVGLLVSLFRSSRNTFSLQQSLLASLEQAVASRTRALELAAAVSRHLSSITQKNKLVVEVVEELKRAFDYYHAHIYLLDEKGETLRMEGGTGEVGNILLERGHSLPIGKGLVGRAALNAVTVLVSDTAADPAWLPNPLLPETRAEIAVPIKMGARVLGVLDVQNNKVNSLGEQDILLIETVAEQVGVALENIRANDAAQALLNDYQQLLENAPAAIALLDAETGTFVQANPQMQALFGISLDDLGKIGLVELSPETQPDGRPSLEAAQGYIRQALEKGFAAFQWVHRSRAERDFRAEIRLTPAPSRMGRAMLSATITDITERYQQEEQVRKNAQRQELLNRVTQRIQNAATVEEALQVAARELGHALGVKPALVSLRPPARQNPSSQS